MSTNPRDPETGRYLPHKSRLRKPRGTTTRVKVIGAELSYKERGSDKEWGAMSKAIRDVNRRAHRLQVPFMDFKKVWFAQNMRIFEAEGIPRWAPLSPSYEAWKRTVVGDVPILQLTGRLGRSLTQDTEDTLYSVHPKSLQMGTHVPYSGPLQGDANRPDGMEAKGNLPPREHDVLLPETFAILTTMVGSYIELPLEEAIGGQ